MRAVSSLLLCWLVLLASATGTGQSPSSQLPRFRTGVDIVQLDVTVLDRDRQPVRGLTAGEFTVLEDGKPRPIVAFSAIELPELNDTATASPIAAPADVATNELPDGRLVVILMDHVLRSPEASVMGRRTARGIVDSLGPGDLGAVVHTMFGVPQNLTTDRARLAAAIDSSVLGTVKPEELDGERGDCHCGTCKAEAVTRIAEALHDERYRRKTIVFVGEQFPAYPTGTLCDEYLEPATKKMIRATQLANVAVHAVDPNGLEVTSVGASVNFKPEPEGAAAAAKAQEQANRSGLLVRHDSLRALADVTGGRTVVNTNAPEASVKNILDESRGYYVVAFQSALPEPDGGYHPVAVSVRRPDLQVLTRRGYYAMPATPAGSDAPLTVKAVAESVLPQRGLPLALTAAPFRQPDGSGSAVVMAVGVRSDLQAPAGSADVAAESPELQGIEILTSAFPRGSTDVEWHRQTLAVAAPATAPGELLFEATSHLNLMPGHYELRVAVRHEKSGRTGTVHADVDVPNFDRGALTLSGIVLNDAAAPTATPPEALGGLVDIPPTTRRSFTDRDEVTAMVRVYRRGGRQPVVLTFRVIDPQKTLHASEAATIAVERFRTAGFEDARFRLPLERLRPGTYALHVEASNDGTTVGRDLLFSVK